MSSLLATKQALQDGMDDPIPACSQMTSSVQSQTQASYIIRKVRGKVEDGDKQQQEGSPRGGQGFPDGT